MIVRKRNKYDRSSQALYVMIMSQKPMFAYLVYQMCQSFRIRSEEFVHLTLIHPQMSLA